MQLRGRCATQSKSIKLCSSLAAVVPQSKSSKSTESCSQAAVVPHKVNLPSCVVAQQPLCHKVKLPSCVARRLLCHKVNLPSCAAHQQPLCHKVNLPRCEARRHHFIMTCDVFRSGQLHVIYSEKPINQPTVGPLKSLKSTHSTKLLKKLY